MGSCCSKSKPEKKLKEPLLTLDEIYEPVFSTEEYYQIVGTAKLIRKKYDSNKKSSANII